MSSPPVAVPPAWRRSQWLQELNRRVPSYQIDRFSKICDPCPEPFFLVARPNVAPNTQRDLSKVVAFQVSGSTQSVYTVKVSLSNGSTSCNCMDARMNCRKLSCVCKHVCFVLFRVMRMEDIDFFSTMHVSASDLQNRFHLNRNGTGLLADDNTEVYQPPPVSAVSHLHNSHAVEMDNGAFSWNNVKRRPGDEDECPVCYTLLLPPSMQEDICKSDIRGCPDCGNAIHKECAKKWMSMFRNRFERTCVICRSGVWSSWDLT